AYDEIVALLRGGGIIAFPTDTSYGLGVDPFNESAIARIFEVKGRPDTKPILLLVDSVTMAESITDAGAVFRAVAERFWPGPLTLILNAAASISTQLTAGTKTIGLRWPAAPVATALVHRLGKPITATSANRRGSLSAVT